MAVEMRFVPFSLENYSKLLNNGLNTPCGLVKLGKYQFLKLKGNDSRGRPNLI
jgi:hypothetical protein